MSFSPLRSSDELLNRVQDNIGRVINPLIDNPLLDGVLLDFNITTTATKYPHGLGRKPMGWFLVAPQADARVWQTASDSTTLTLTASAAVTCSLWVF